MQKYADIYSLLFPSNVVWSGLRPDQTTLEGSSGTSSMTCTGGYGYSF